MATITAENILHLIEQMPPNEQLKLKQLMEQRTAMQSPSEAANGTSQPSKQLDKRLPSKPMPDSTRERQWLAEHRREYANQWVALDGDRLIASGKDHDPVWAAAEADGAYLPLITFIEDPDNLTTIIWT